MSKRILLTGCAGFIGYHISKRLISDSISQYGIDNINSYYDVSLKKSRIKSLQDFSDSNDYDFLFEEKDITDLDELRKIVDIFNPNTICHVAAQAGVRYSVENPTDYLKNNVQATLNLLEIAKERGIKDFIFASTSSIYGLDSKQPFVESSSANKPESTYAASKKSCELLCHVYHKLYGIKFRILRFFTVYGPWGRPDMAPMLFAKSIINNEPINIFNNGEMNRDFTYIDDIVDGFISAINSDLKFEIINLGNGNPIKLMDFISTLEDKIGKRAIKNYMEMQQGDVMSTNADITKAKNLLNFSPRVSLSEGVSNFVNWYFDYYDIE